MFKDGSSIEFGGYESSDSTVLFPFDTLEIGPKDYLRVPLSVVNHNLQQQRHVIDEDALGELKSALREIDEFGAESIALQNPPHYNFVPEDNIEAYLAEHAAAYKTGSTCSIDELVPVMWSDIDPAGEEIKGYLIVEAGHRRTKAIIQILDEWGYDISRTRIVAHVDFNASLSEVIDKQYRENNHQNLTPYEDACAIFYRYTHGLQNIVVDENGNETYEFKSGADCARKLGISPDKVYSAVNFMRLPANVRLLVEHGHMPYHRALEVQN